MNKAVSRVSRGQAFALMLFNLFLLAAAYVLFVRTEFGQRLEQLVLDEADYSTDPSFPLGLVEPEYVAALVLLISVAIWFLGSRAQAFYVWVIVGVLLVSTQLMKMILPRPDLLAVDEQFLENTFPSGHMGIFVILGLFLVTITPQAFQKTVFWLVSSINLVVAWQLLANGWHRPSDLIAAVCFSVLIYLFFVFLIPGFIYIPASKRSNTSRTLNFVSFLQPISVTVFWAIAAVLVIHALSKGFFAIAVGFVVFLVIFLLSLRGAVSTTNSR